MPRLYEALQFEIVSEVIPSNWEIRIFNNTLLIVGPKEWRENGFWDKYYDHHSDALEAYQREAQIIYEEEIRSMSIV
jgi:hypothetical protein